MRLSEAIRLGTMLRPRKAMREFVRGTQAACVLGAAGIAVGCWMDDSMSDHAYLARLIDVFPILDNEARAVCPACDLPYSTVTYVIMHLNDDHRWSRERIADWVEALEGSASSQISDTRADQRRERDDDRDHAERENDHGRCVVAHA